jgi:hypothetical protein
MQSELRVSAVLIAVGRSADAHDGAGGALETLEGMTPNASREQSSGGKAGQDICNLEVIDD